VIFIIVHRSQPLALASIGLLVAASLTNLVLSARTGGAR
jgi:hypothetical protein